MKRSDFKFGQEVFLNRLRYTEESFGADEGLRQLVGSYIKIHEYADNTSNAIVSLHPTSAYRYSIHINDLLLEAPEKPIDDELRIIKVAKGEEVLFDESQIFI